MKVQYIGERAREVAPPYSQPFLVTPGEVFEVDDDLGASLLEQTERFTIPAKEEE